MQSLHTRSSLFIALAWQLLVTWLLALRIAMATQMFVFIRWTRWKGSLRDFWYCLHYGYNTVYCLMSHCGEREYWGVLWAFLPQLICLFSNERTCTRYKDVEGLSCGFWVFFFFCRILSPFNFNSILFALETSRSTRTASHKTSHSLMKISKHSERSQKF